MDFSDFLDYMQNKGYKYLKPIGAVDPRDDRRAIFKKFTPPPDEPVIVPIRGGIVPREVIDRLKRLLGD